MLVANQLSRNEFFVIVAKIYAEADFSTVFLVLSSLAWFFYLLPNILSRIVYVYYSWEYIVSMRASIKTGIISVASKKGDYILKHLKLSHQKL